MFAGLHQKEPVEVRHVARAVANEENAPANNGLCLLDRHVQRAGVVSTISLACWALACLICILACWRNVPCRTVCNPCHRRIGYSWERKSTLVNLYVDH